MEKIEIRVPAMYGDHHVLEVRRVLLALPGVTQVYASSSFQTVQVGFDPALIGAETITAELERAGYLQSLRIAIEPGVPSYGGAGTDSSFRHTAPDQQSRLLVQFGQRVAENQRPLWPCPGMGVISRDEDGENG